MYRNMRWAKQVNLVSNKVKAMFYILFRELSNILGKRKLSCSM